MDCDRLFISIGSVIIDDIILPHGESRMAMLGGGATHAVMGMRVWSSCVGLVAAIGNDFPADLHNALGTLFDLKGVVVRPVRTPRAWQLFEKDGTRNEIFRTPENEMVEIFPRLDEFPDEYRDVAGVHLHCPLQDLPDWVRLLRSHGDPVILWEPWDRMCVPENQAAFHRLCPLIDMVSPNLREAQILTGQVEPFKVASELISYGSPAVALRMGSQGSLVARQGGDFWHIPAMPPAQIVDVTGAGNAYCGGFIVGFALTRNLEKAGTYGAVAASFTLEQFGVLYAVDAIHQRAALRFRSHLLPSKNPRRQFFNLAAPHWDDRLLPPGVDVRMRTTAQKAQAAPGILLDIGSGTGSMLPFLQEFPHSLFIPIDISQEMLSVGKNKVGEKSKVSPAVADACWLPISSGSISAVICHGVLPHFDSIHAAFTEFQRVLKNGGRLVISHTIGRQRVNDIHRSISDKALKSDYLPPAVEIATVLEEMGWSVLESNDSTDTYLIVALKSQLSD